MTRRPARPGSRSDTTTGPPARPPMRRGDRPALRLLSLGAGVQSTTVLLLACEGTIPTFDIALFADTGWEPRAVYGNLERLRAHAAKAGIPVRTVSAGNIRTDALDPNHRFVSMPLHTRNPDGSKGLARRQCTTEYKIIPLKKAARNCWAIRIHAAYRRACTPTKPSASASTKSPARRTPGCGSCATCSL